jgi:hypothetical protein
MFNGPVKSRQKPTSVIPTKVGIQEILLLKNFWTPVFTGVTIFYETVMSNNFRRITCRKLESP